MNLTSGHDAFLVVMKPVSDRFNARLDLFNVFQIWLPYLFSWEPDSHQSINYGQVNYSVNA